VDRNAFGLGLTIDGWGPLFWQSDNQRRQHRSQPDPQGRTQRQTPEPKARRDHLCESTQGRNAPVRPFDSQSATYGSADWRGRGGARDCKRDRAEHGLSDRLGSEAPTARPRRRGRCLVERAKMVSPSSIVCTGECCEPVRHAPFAQRGSLRTCSDGRWSHDANDGVRNAEQTECGSPGRVFIAASVSAR